MNNVKELLNLIMEVVTDDGINTINDYYFNGDIDYDNAKRQIKEVVEEKIKEYKLSSIDKVVGTLEVYGSDVLVNIDGGNKDGEYLILRVRDGE